MAAALILGLLLGARHSLDPDHVVAVSTMVTEYRNPIKAIWVGVSWGLGHTTHSTHCRPDRYWAPRNYT